MPDPLQKLADDMASTPDSVAHRTATESAAKSTPVPHTYNPATGHLLIGSADGGRTWPGNYSFGSPYNPIPPVAIGPGPGYYVDHRGQPVDFEPTPARSTARDLGRRYPSFGQVVLFVLVLIVVGLWVAARVWQAMEGGR